MDWQPAPGDPEPALHLGWGEVLAALVQRVNSPWCIARATGPDAGFVVSTDPDEVRRRLAELDGLQARCGALADAGQGAEWFNAALRDVVDVEDVEEPVDLVDIARVLAAAVTVHALVPASRDAGSDPPRLDALVAALDGLDPNPVLAERLERSLDLDGEDPALADAASPELAQARGHARRARKELAAAAQRLVSGPELADVLADRFWTEREGRVVIPVKAGSMSRGRGGPRVAGGQGLVVSGPNAVGKTVALKTIGLSVLMAQIRLRLPTAAPGEVPNGKTRRSRIAVDTVRRLDDFSATRSLAQPAQGVRLADDADRWLAESAVPDHARRDPPTRRARLGPVGFALLTCLSLGCDSSERKRPVPSVEPPAPKQDVGVPPPLPPAFSGQPIANPKREITIRLEDVQEMEIIDLQVSEAPPFTRGKVGRPRTLLTAKNLRLSDDRPMANNRGLVEITAGPGYRAKTLEAVLVDFKTGEVARFADAFSQLRGMDVQFGKQVNDEGELQSVLIHPDGLAVPWVPEGMYRTLTDLVVNNGHKEIYLFAQNTDWKENGLGTVFSMWTDLRAPPPPTLKLSFQPVASSMNTDWFGEYTTDRSGISKQNVTASGRSRRVEILRDGTTRRIPFTDVVLGDGWHLTKGLGYEWVAYNEALSEVQHIEVGPTCRPWRYIADRRSFSPPRVDFSCTRDNAFLVWSPEKMVRLPMTEDRRSPRVERSITGHLAWWYDSSGDYPDGCNVVAIIDFVQLKQFETRHLVSRSVAHSDRYMLASPCDVRVLHAIDVEAGLQYPLAKDTRCSELSYVGHDRGLWSYDCLGADGRGRRFEVVDFKRLKRWRIDGIHSGAGKHWSEVWVQAATRTVVWVARKGGKDVLLAWDLR